jgi:4-hydroxy-3-methylbut-2-enyl diphosphate reductase
MHGTVGVTAGASAPDELVAAVIDRLRPMNGVSEVRTTEEDEYFPPPRNIRQLQAAMERAITALAGGPAKRDVFDDRYLTASSVLEMLSS